MARGSEARSEMRYSRKSDVLRAVALLASCSIMMKKKHGISCSVGLLLVGVVVRVLVNVHLASAHGAEHGWSAAVA